MNWFEHEYPYTNFHELNLDWVIKRVKECIEGYISLNKHVDELNTDFNKLNEYVLNYFKNLDVSEEINNKIEELYRNGLLDDIIDATMKKFNFYEVADMYPLFQTFDRINVSPIQLNAQGMCIAVIDETPVICTTLVNSDNTECHVYLNNVSSGEEIYKVNEPRFGHANGVTYYNRKFYFTSPYGGEGKIATLDYDTKEVEIINLNIDELVSVHAMDYDSITNSFVCRGQYKNSKRIFHLSLDFTNITDYSPEIKYNYNGRYEQSIKCDNDFFYLVDGRYTRDNIGAMGKITVFDREFNVVSTVLTPSTYELEDIAFYNGECYFYLASFGCGCTMLGAIRPTQNMYGTHMSVYEYNELSRFATTNTLYFGWKNCKFKCDGTQTYPFFAQLYSLVVLSKNYHHVTIALTENVGSDVNPFDVNLSMNGINIKRADLNLRTFKLTGDVFGSITLIRISNGTIRYLPANQYRTHAVESEGQLEILDVTFENCGSSTPIHCLDDILIRNYSSDTTNDFDISGNFKTNLRYENCDKLQCANISNIKCNNTTNLNALTNMSNEGLTRKILPDGFDLDDLLASGNYYLTDGYSFLGLPEGVTGLREIDVLQANTLVRQTVTSRGATTNGYKMYTRDIILDQFPSRAFIKYFGTWHKIVDESQP